MSTLCLLFFLFLLYDKGLPCFKDYYKFSSFPGTLLAEASNPKRQKEATWKKGRLFHLRHGPGAAPSLRSNPPPPLGSIRIPAGDEKNFETPGIWRIFRFGIKKKNLLLHFYKGHLQKKPVLVLFQNMEKSSVICKTVKDLSGMLKSIYIHLCYPKHAGFFGLRAWALAFGILVSRMKNFRLPNL